MDHATVVEDAVKRFYATGSSEVHTWMLQVQASTEAWSLIWQLLQPTKSWEIQFFAASTLHSKVSRQWKEVPENEYLTLQTRIVDSMKMPNTSSMVLAKLCQALASFLANTNISDERGVNAKEVSLIDQVIEILPYDTPQTLDLLLRVLTMIPGEYERRQFRERLWKCWGKTAWLLQQIFQTYERSMPGSTEESLYHLSLECALAWLKLGQLPLDITAQIYPHFLVAAAKYAPSREDEEHLDSHGWEVTQECLTIAVNHGELYKRPMLFWEWSKDLVSLARQRGGTVFCTILTSLGEANSRMFLLALTEDTDETHRWTSETLIELLLECSEHKGRYPVDETRSCIPFGFWFVLQDNISMMDQPIDSRARNALRPIYTRLAHALLRKATLPATPSEAGDAEERELLRCYRQDAADTLIHCCLVLGKDLFVILGQRLSQLETTPQKWTDVESTLHAFNALTVAYGPSEDEYVAALIDLIVSHVPYGHYPSEVLACACSAIGAYAEWIGEHPDPWLERVLQLISHGLSVNSITSTPASMALKDIARECGPHLAPFAPSILEMISRTLRNLPPKSGEGMRLMNAAGKLLNSLNTVEEQMCHLDATLGLCIGRLRETLEFGTQPVKLASAEVVCRLKMITTFLSNIEGNIGKIVLDGVLPIFMLIIGHPELSCDSPTLEAMHNCMERSLLSLSNPELEARPLLSIITTSYKTYPHPAALNLFRQVALVFGKDPENLATAVFAEISAHTLGGVAACRSVGGDLSDLTELLQAYLNLLQQICKKNLRMLDKVPEQIPDMLRCGMACLTLPEAPTVKAAGSFLHHVIIRMAHNPNDSEGLLTRYIQPIGQELICVILQCIGSGTLLSRNFEPYAEVLCALNVTRLEWLRRWLRLALDDANAPIATDAQKADFTMGVLNRRANKFETEVALKHFSLLCQRRGIGL